MEAATIDRTARVLSSGAARRGVLHGLGGFAVATVVGTALPRAAAADEKTCERRENRCRRRCRRKHQGGLLGCRFKCERYCYL